MTTDATAYKSAAYPPTPYQHYSDEDVAYTLDKSDKHRKAARKAQETQRQKRAEQQAQEKSA